MASLRDYFAAHGYTIVGRYLRADRHNLYFTSLSPDQDGGSWYPLRASAGEGSEDEQR
jgi:hypothetical protein